MDSRDYFIEVASKWDQLRQDFFSEEIREKAYEMAGVKAGELAGDIGAGTGFVSEGLLERGLRVIAVDRSEDMLAEMKHKFKDYDGFQCLQGDAEKLPIESGSLDYVMANMFLHHVETPLVAIREMVRILKPGGKLVITDLDKHEHEFLVTEQHDRWMGFLREDMTSWLHEAGLKNVGIDCAGGNCCATSCSCEDSASINIFAAYDEK